MKRAIHLCAIDHPESANAFDSVCGACGLMEDEIADDADEATCLDCFRLALRGAMAAVERSALTVGNLRNVIDSWAHDVDCARLIARRNGTDPRGTVACDCNVQPALVPDVEELVLKEITGDH